MKLKVTALVPTYNEGKRVKYVLESLSKSKYIDEILCIDDGSTDNTSATIKDIKRVRLIQLTQNHGKAFAIAQGVLAATGDIVLFIDADILGLSDNALKLLIDPLQNKIYDAVIGYRANVHEMFWFRALTGERAYYRQDLLQLVDQFKDKGYCLELFLNYEFRYKHILRLHLPGVVQTWKRYKMPYFISLHKDIAEIFDLLCEISRQKRPLKYFYYSYLRGFYI